ncbi:MAG: energy transducer TonB [Rhodospirillales bacterium]|nr:energy transducer TonB [Rhodospirillales bacterium]
MPPLPPRQVRIRTATAPGSGSAPPAAATLRSSRQASSRADWLRSIAAWLAAHRSYPPQARRAGEQGTVVLRLVIAQDGTVRRAALLAGSGHADLDRASLATVRGAHLPPARWPDAPAEVRLRVPIRYALETSG